MDVIFLFSVIFVTLGINQAHATLKCLECTHIGFNREHNFEGAEHVYKILQSRYNPVCASQDPSDKTSEEYIQIQQQQLNVQQQQQLQLQSQLPGQQGVVYYPRDNDVGETICPAISDSNRCNYLSGGLVVELPSYGNAQMNLVMHVRNCVSAVSQGMENMSCYSRNTQYGYHDIRLFFQDRLTFLGNDVKVVSFDGQQCVCNTNLCAPRTSGSTTVVASTVTMVITSILYFIIAT